MADNDKKRESSAGVGSAKKRKTGFLFEQFIPFSGDSSPVSKPVPKPVSKPSPMPGLMFGVSGFTSAPSPKPITTASSVKKISTAPSAKKITATPSAKPITEAPSAKKKIKQPKSLTMKNKRRKLLKKVRRLKVRSTSSFTDQPASQASEPEFEFKPPILIQAPDSSVKLESASPTSDQEEGAENQRTSFCQSEESIDLNDLRGMVGFNDFDKSDLKHDDDDSSSQSSYCTLPYDSVEAECDPDFGCVSLNIDINKKRKRSENSESEEEKPFFESMINNQMVDLSESDIDQPTSELPEIKKETEVKTEPEDIGCNQSQANSSNYFNYANPLYVTKPVPKSSQSNGLPNGLEPTKSSPADDDDDVVFVCESSTRKQSNGPTNAQPNARVPKTKASKVDPMKVLFPKKVDLVDISKPYTNPNEVYPWVNRVYSWGIIGLHEEIEDFHEYSRLKRAEIKVRNLLFARVKDLITRRWPDAQVLAFGSFQTGLSLPFADLDVVVLVRIGARVPFQHLEAQLVQEGITTHENVKIITRAVVPIIRFIHKDTGLSVDMSFNSEDGPRALGLINDYVALYPALPKLLLIIKLMLHQRGLNFSYTGGLSSYSLTLMFVNFFQQHPRVSVRQDGTSNLGVLLLEFLELYGCTFDAKQLAIRVRDSVGYVRKNEMACLNENEMTLNRLCIEDPMDPFNNPSKNSTRWEEIRSVFKHAFNIISERCRLTEQGYDPEQKTILSELIGYTTGEVELRERVLEYHRRELETFEEKRDKKRDKKRVCLDFNSDFVPFSLRVPDVPFDGFQADGFHLGGFHPGSFQPNGFQPNGFQRPRPGGFQFGHFSRPPPRNDYTRDTMFRFR